jgi:hypothetical protein
MSMLWLTMKTITKLYIGLGILAVLSPAGLVLPAYFNGGDAWGEWGTDTIKNLTGYIPAGMKKVASVWSAPLADYAFKGQESAGFGSLSITYIASAIAGVALCIGAAYLIAKLLVKKEK